MPIRRNVMVSASCCVHIFCSQTCPAEAGTAPDPWRSAVVYLSFKVEPPWIRFYFFGGQVELSCSWEPSWTILALCQATFNLLPGVSVLPCSCNSLTATSLCTTWGTEVDMASHFCTTSYSWDTWGQTIFTVFVLVAVKTLIIISVCTHQWPSCFKIVHLHLCSQCTQ